MIARRLVVMFDVQARFRKAVRPFLTAVMFLTRLPCPRWVTHDSVDLARSTVYFPVVGALVGGIGAGVFLGAHLIWPPIVALIVALAAVTWSTGALHEDGLADTVDGFGGGWTEEDALSIMKDSRIGTYGVLGLLFVVAAKLAVLATMTPIGIVKALVAGHVLGRWSSLPLIWQYEYVREASATSTPIAWSVTSFRLVLGTVGAAAIVALVLQAQALPVLGAALCVTGLAGWFFRRSIGGITGDTLGAANKVVELSTYLVLGGLV